MNGKPKGKIPGEVFFFSYGEVSPQAPQVYIWDLDKTYLEPHGFTLGGIWKTLLGRPHLPKHRPGFNILLSCMKSLWEKKGSSQGLFPLFFLSTSSPFLEPVIREDLKMQSISPMGFFFKKSRGWTPKFWKNSNSHMGYKLQALMEVRSRLALGTSMILWGDDSESDAVTYSLYSDICTRRQTKEELWEILNHYCVGKNQIESIFELQTQCPSVDPVEKIYIHLALDTDPEYYLKFGRRMVPTYNSFQTSLDLFQGGHIKKEDVLRVARDLTTNYGFSVDELESSLDDLIRRRVVARETLDQLLTPLQENKMITPDYSPSVSPESGGQPRVEQTFGVQGETEPWVPEHIDYLHDYRW